MRVPRRVLVVFAVAMVTIGSVGSAGAAVPSATSHRGSTDVRSASAGCAKVVLYGVPGSGEGTSLTSMGPTVGAVAADLKADLVGTVKVDRVPVSYPAITVFDAIDADLVNGVNYPTSRADGVAALSGLVTQQLKACPSTWIVLAGFSQGADVIGAYLDQGLPAKVLSRIAGVALLGDPRFNKADQSIDVGSFNHKYGPVEGKFTIPPEGTPEGPRPVSTAPLSTKTISVCNKGDPICNYTWSNMVGCFGISAWKSFYASIIAHIPVPVPALRSSCAHEHYKDAGPPTVVPGQPVTATAVAQYLAAKVRAALSRASWTVTEAPLPANAGTYPNVHMFSSVACPSVSSCVAIGNYEDSGGATQGLLLTGYGTSWTATEAPIPHSQNPAVGLNSVACPSVSSCTVVGDYLDQSEIVQGLLVTGSGSSWKAINAPLPPNTVGDPFAFLTSVACPSASSCTATGFYGKSQSGPMQGLLLTRSGTSWTATKAPLPSGAAAASNQQVVFNSVACPSASSCTATGAYKDSSGTTQGLLLTGSGTSWTATKAPLPNGAGQYPAVNLTSVACPSASSCTSVGTYYDSSNTTQSLLETGSGTSWKATQVPSVALPDVSVSPSVTCPSVSFCVAVGTYDRNTGLGVLLTGSGASWTATDAPAPANNSGQVTEPVSVACASTTSCVISGDYVDTSSRGEGMLVTGPG